MLGQIRDKVEAGKRLDRAEGQWLLTEAPLLDLGSLAQEERFRRIPDRQVTFVIDSNPNYTNVCVTDCQFCAFYRKPGDPDAYTLTVDEVMAKVEAAARHGATTILLQGGHNPALPLEYYLSLVRETRRRFPGVTPHFFTASEIQTVAQVAAKSIAEIITALKEAGLGTLPGGGAEIFHPEVRDKICEHKADADAWIRIHREAHELGLRSNATMLYGHIESARHRIEHLIREVRSGQLSDPRFNTRMRGEGKTAEMWPNDHAVVAARDVDVAFAAVRAMARRTAVLALCTTALAVLAGVALARRITSPLRHLAEVTSAVARGEFSRRVPVTSRNELGQLASNFNLMAAEVESFILSLRRALRGTGELHDPLRQRINVGRKVFHVLRRRHARYGAFQRPEYESGGIRAGRAGGYQPGGVPQGHRAKHERRKLSLAPSHDGGLGVRHAGD